MSITTTQIKQLLIDAFDLEYSVEEIPDDMQIVGAGLELDSVDVLEIVSQIYKQFKIKIKNQDINPKAFTSIAELTSFINNYPR
ncbi:MAG: phosphopantetheine-binding protein [Bdellovibrionales bacterium]